MQCPDYYEFSCRGHLVAGHQALEKIPGLLSGMGTQRPMVLTDAGVKGAGLLDILIQSLSGGLTPAAVEDEVPPDSDVTRVNELAAIYRAKECDSLIALGGGSVLDTAKGINILVSEEGDDLMAFTGAGALKRPLKPLIAVPTTAGTGSEVTLVAVIADHANHRKLAFMSTFLQPDAAVVDSRMTLTLPPHVTAQTAMDALSHAVEACYGLAQNPISKHHAFSAIKGIRKNLVHVVKNPGDKEGRLALATAATLAGAAFSNSMVGMVHTLGHSVGGVCGVPHGTCMAILLPYGMAYNAPRVEAELGELLLPLAGSRTYTQTPKEQRPKQAVETVRQLNQALHGATEGRHPTCFRECRTPDGRPAVPREKIPDIAEMALGDGSLMYNPADLDKNDFITVMEAAWEGRPLTRETRT
ncbi:MAG: iron-containing alcohol dehydrogenase [Desulfobacterales bacterium]|nr:iron-containing alcohol dehydrogenase [Desulfobacterales bacterium]